MAAKAAASAAVAPEAVARGYLRELGHRYALPAQRADEVPALFTQQLQHASAKFTGVICDSLCYICRNSRPF